MKKKRTKIVISKKTVRVLGAIGKTLVVLVVVAGAAFLSARLMGKVAVSNATDSLRRVKYIFSQNKDYPYAMESLNTRFVDIMDDELIILYNDHTQTLNSLAVPMMSVQTDSSDTKVYCANGRALIVDSTARTAVLQSKTEKLGEITCDNEIGVAALGNNGCFAVASKGRGVQSNLTVYSTRLQPVFSWNCSNERISDISLSRSGKNVAVSVIGANNARLYSRLLVFNTAQSKPVGEIKLNCVVLKINYTSKGNIIVIGDNGVRSYTSDCKQISEYAFTENTLSHTASDERGNTCVCISEFGGSKSRLVCFGADGKQKYNFSIEGEVSCVSMHGGKAAALSGQTVTVYNSKGEAVKALAAASAPEKIMYYGSGFYTVEKAVICKYRF